MGRFFAGHHKDPPPGEEGLRLPHPPLPFLRGVWPKERVIPYLWAEGPKNFEFLPRHFVNFIGETGVFSDTGPFLEDNNPHMDQV